MDGWVVGKSLCTFALAILYAASFSAYPPFHSTPPLYRPSNFFFPFFFQTNLCNRSTTIWLGLAWLGLKIRVALMFSCDMHRTYIVACAKSIVFGCRRRGRRRRSVVLSSSSLHLLSSIHIQQDCCGHY